MYNQTLRSDPYNGCALYGMANALDKSGQHEEAAKDYDLAKKLNPSNAACGTDTANSPPKVSPPSQVGAVVVGISVLFH